MHGIIPLYKPKGMTSHDCVMKIRRMLQTKKVGHTGTLDPSVEGVLPICVGEATKIISFLLPLHKQYIADVFLGRSTTTEDADGETVEEKTLDSVPTEEEIRQVLASFTGEIIQIPPMYSAIKVNGKKLYEYARENIEIERPERKVMIYNIEHLHSNGLITNPFRIKVTCSKGTYIRTLSVDIGKALGYPAHMSFLKRMETDGFHLDETITFEEIERKIDENNIPSMLLPVEKAVRHLYHYSVDEKMKDRVLQGQKFPKPSDIMTNDPFAMMYEQKLLAIYEIHPNHPNLIKPVRVFNLHK
ncbi:MAG TPA: tRNA pseudouridine(55) synthase TruB [Candidatus Pseudogracilibacillus intestinigallinarum]|uniref:tRNA pseudouridine synthase B n=1 Tax=Candidatus Pseudogracilibacillus intestinigallinarum TaxID=2838742 RepID=A0A9D1PNF0_9BACI|nr:tRNA pseudouridine(55) synthase TruB [Candidatus Pseudogracilibacillus intestinigallinarum]